MRPTAPRLKSRITLATAIVAATAALLLILALFATGPAAAQSGRPQISGSIAIVNETQPEGVYLHPGDTIWFRIRPTKDLETVSMTPAVTAANHFHFAFVSGGAARKAQLVGSARDAQGQFLLYRHIIAAGSGSTAANGQLYFRLAPAPAVSAALQAADGSGQFMFNPPADNAALSGSVRVGAAGASATLDQARQPSGNVSDIEVVNPPASGWHQPGDTIILRAMFSKRLTPDPDPGAAARLNRLELLVGPNAGNTALTRSANLTRVGNVGRQGYIEYQYTVQAGDQDADGIKVHSVITNPASQVCPAYTGPGCPAAVSVRSKFATGDVNYAIPGSRIAGADLDWSYYAKRSLTLSRSVNYSLDGSHNTIGGVTGNVPGRPVFYAAQTALPAGLKLGQRHGQAVIYGAPSATSTVRDFTITVADTTGRRADLTIAITVEEYVPLALPANADGSRDVVTYVGAYNRGGALLPHATGNQPITYSLTRQNGDPLPLCVRYNGTPGWPGYVTLRIADNAPCGLTTRTTEILRLTAHSPGGRTATMDFNFTIDPGQNPVSPQVTQPIPTDPGRPLDTDGDGLIEISTPEQLMAIRYDTDGDGRIPAAISDDEYYDTGLTPQGGFNARPGRPTGCPASTGCIGYELVNDIDLSRLNEHWKNPDRYHILTKSGALDGSRNVQWTTHTWNAVFDGQGFAISGIDFRQPAEYPMGLFGIIGANGAVRNLGLINPIIHGSQAVGAIAGVNRGTIENVYVQKGTVTADVTTAGLIAGENHGVIRNFWATGSVNAPSGRGATAGGNYNAGTISQGWTNGFTEANIPLSNSQGQTPLTGFSSYGGNISRAYEIDARGRTEGDDVKYFIVTEVQLRTGTAAGKIPSNWSTAIWNFGDNCQRPTLKSGGHDPARQSDARLPACAASP